MKACIAGLLLTLVTMTGSVFAQAPQPPAAPETEAPLGGETQDAIPELPSSEIPDAAAPAAEADLPAADEGAPPDEPGAEPPSSAPAEPETLPANESAAPAAPQREAVAAPAAPIAEGGEFIHEGEPLWPDYYGPDYLGYDRGHPIGCGCCACETFIIPHGWGQFDYLMWWGKGANLPAIVTTSTPGTAINNAGILGQPTTSVLFGDEKVDGRMRSGGRLNTGIWLDKSREIGIGGSFLGLGRSATHYGVFSPGEQIIARPFFNVSSGSPDSEVVSFPGVLEGVVSARTSNDLIGAEAYVREALFKSNRRRLDLLYGYRFLRVDESVSISDRTISIDPFSFVPVGTTVYGSESFLTRNAFHGGEMGLWYQNQQGRWGWDATGKIALGNIHETAIISGVTKVMVPGIGNDTQQGSLLALPSNIGRYSRDRFTVVPELQFNLTYCLSQNIRARFGYTFLYMSRVAQAARQIDTGVNPSQIGGDPLVGAARPAFHFKNSDFWAQGMNFGLEFNW